MSINSSEVPGPYPQILSAEQDGVSDADEAFDFTDVCTHEQVK